ncbi:MAG: GNAT family N-acetyltransferase [Sedimentisphaerales bacterium]|nr:GNAT family N-acetyltransferase [Planctomycetota bacterium]MDY0356532.1 GNAT family N-acetyltransferase [Sedimentisphaerales bacterium]NLT77300.1 GNAT family N-acetyltransferase [Planctomycetota bacterium]
MIRRFRDSDMEDVINIWLDASVEAHDFIDRQFWRSKVGDMKDVYLPACETYVYEDEQGIRGFLSLEGNTLAALFVSPECQGQGIGRKLVERAKDLRDHLELCVYKDNHKSVRFYETCGFRSVSEKLDKHTGCPESVMRFCG